MRRVWVLCLLAGSIVTAAEEPKRVNLMCHRTANEDVPENTLESLEQAALLGCDVVEIDVRKTLDGKLVLSHDGFLERLTDGVGEAETSYYGDLALRDAGMWMGERFAGIHMALFEDALRVARRRNIRLVLDIKTKGIGADILSLVRQEGMLDRVTFGGEWEDVKALYPEANKSEANAWMKPGVTAEEVAARHKENKRVIVNFSANTHGLDIAAMRAAVAAGADGINVDYPRLGAEAVGRPVESKIAALKAKAATGESAARAQAILELGLYWGFSLQPMFVGWLKDADDRVSRAAALALVTARPRTEVSSLDGALRSECADARANAAWAVGMLGGPVDKLLPLLQDSDAHVLEETLMAMGRLPGDVDAAVLLPLLDHSSGNVRGAAALALAQHKPEIATRVIPIRLQAEVKLARVSYEKYMERGKPQLSQGEIREITGYFRSEMKMMQALALLHNAATTQVMEGEAFRAGEDFSQTNGLVAAFQLWDRIGGDAAATKRAIEALGSDGAQVADHAEWMLIHAGPEVLPDVWNALDSINPEIRMRAIRIVAWRGDRESLERLKTMKMKDAADVGLIDWGIGAIERAGAVLQTAP